MRRLISEKLRRALKYFIFMFPWILITSILVPKFQLTEKINSIESALFFLLLGLLVMFFAPFDDDNTPLKHTHGIKRWLLHLLYTFCVFTVLLLVFFLVHVFTMLFV